jgi:hypothetical protein
VADPFIPKTFLEIIEDAINHARANCARVTDYNVGSVARTLLESPAIEIDALYQAWVEGLLAAIPTAIYEGFSFDRLAATTARGVVEFSVDEVPGAPITIPAGTIVRDPYRTMNYATQSSASITSLSASVQVVADIAGPTGNAGAGTLVVFAPAIDGVSVVNPTAFLGGMAEETDDERRIRFGRFIRSLARGTIASLEYAARTVQIETGDGMVVERVIHAVVSETPGHVDLFVHNGTGGTSDELVTAVETVVEGVWDAENGRWIAGYRPAGMRVDVEKAAELAVDVILTVSAPEGLRGALVAEIETAVATTIRERQAARTLNPIAIVNAVLAVPGVTGCLIVSPTAQQTAPSGTIFVAGTTTITWTA